MLVQLVAEQHGTKTPNSFHHFLFMSTLTETDQTEGKRQILIVVRVMLFQLMAEQHHAKTSKSFHHLLFTKCLTKTDQTEGNWKGQILIVARLMLFHQLMAK
jgi:hypothetical protein